MKDILMLATGGTISCRQTVRGLAPSLTGEELLGLVPGISGICRVEVDNPMGIDSTDMTAKDRMKLAEEIWQNYDRFDGFIIAQGTDTLSYTAALMYHVIKGPTKPIIITGSMKPIGEPDSDAEKNLLDSFRVIDAGYVGVAAVLNGRIIRGSHVVKVHTTDPDAFRSIGAPYDGSIDRSGRVWLDVVPEPGGETSFVGSIDDDIMLMKLVPDLDPSVIGFLSRYKKVIIEGFGCGGIPRRLENEVRKLILGGTKVYLTHQCMEGDIDLHRYEAGRRSEAIGVVPLGRRTTEDALAAIMCGEI